MCQFLLGLAFRMTGKGKEGVAFGMTERGEKEGKDHVPVPVGTGLWNDREGRKSDPVSFPLDGERSG